MIFKFQCNIIAIIDLIIEVFAKIKVNSVVLYLHKINIKEKKKCLQ
jgi:hypothetical protein